MASSPDPFVPFEPIGSLKQPRNKDGNISNWVENSFEFTQETKKQAAVPYTKRHMGGNFTNKHMIITMMTFAIVMIILLYRVFTLQILQGEYYRSRAENNRKRNIPIVAERGTIYDRFGNELTKNIPNFALAITPQDLPREYNEREKIVQRLAEITGSDSNFIREQLRIYGNYSYESVVISEDLDYETALSIQIDAGDLPGIQIQRGSKRLYLHPKDGDVSYNAISHILGYMGKLSPEELDALYKSGYLPSDSIGKSGVEKIYERELRGTYGVRQIEVDAKGREQLVIAQKAPVPGKDLVLSLDAEAQLQLQRIMEKHMSTMKVTKGAAVALDPRNGEVLALVSLPSYNNNEFSGGIDQKTYQAYITNPDRPLFNRVIGGAYPSGSTIKPAIALAALQEGIIDASTAFLSNGGIQVGDWFFPDWQAGGHGMTNVRKSLAQSVNTFYYIIGGGYKDITGLGVNRISKYLRLFGFAQLLDIDLPGEQPGFIPSKSWKQQVKNDRWYVGDTYNLSIGQGDLLATPLQIAMLTSIVANDGTIYTPHLKKEFINRITGETIAHKPSILRRDVVDLGHLDTVKKGMRDCVLYGSCRRLSLLPFSSGGKTGTAQWSSVKKPHAWFTGFAPYEQPEIVVTVLIEEGEGGSIIAAPITYEFLYWWGYNRR